MSKAQEPEPQDGLVVHAQGRVGEVLQGKWRLDTLLGVGGMAAVYAATHRNGNRVAVKLLHPHCVAIDAIRSRFQREGYVANMIDHGGAVRVLDDDRTPDGAVFLVMELLEGETLEERIKRRGRLPAEEALGIVYHLLDVLAVAHTKGIVHRDIKLDNVFITNAGQVKVLDFGIARLAETSWQNSADRTRTNATMGTPAFMAPEQALGRSAEVDAKTDLWAVGATLFRLLTARNVHEAATMNEQLVNAATKPAPPLRTILASASPELCALVDKALAFQKDARWPDARAMQEAMQPLLPAPLGSNGMPYVRPSSILMAQRDPSPPARTTEEAGDLTEAVPRRKGLGFLLVGGGLVVAILVAWLLLRPGTPAREVVHEAPPPVVPAKAAVATPAPAVQPQPSPPAPSVEARPAVRQPAAAPKAPVVEKRRKPAARPAQKPASDGEDFWDRRH
jgi:serine/threonine-protein kinase